VLARLHATGAREGAIGLLWLAGGLLPLITLAWVIADPPAVLSAPPPGESGSEQVSLFYVLQIPLFVPVAYVGASLAARPGAAPISWVFLAIGAASGVALFADLYATHAVLLDPGSLPFGDAAAVLTRFVALSHLLMGSLVLAMLPTGWLPAGRARLLILPPLLFGGSTFVVGLVAAGPVYSFPEVDNPIALPGAAGDIAAAIEAPQGAWPFTVAPLALWLLVLATRERERGRRRVYGRVGAMALFIPFGFIALLMIGADELLWLITVALVAIQIDVAVFAARRERLWGMSALVHRTALWAALSAVVAAVYALAVPVAARAGLERDVELALALGLGAAAAAYAALDRALRARLVGEGGDALRALGRLHRGLQGADSPAAVLARAAESAVRGSHSSVDLLVDGGRRRVVGESAADPVRLTLPVVHQSRVVGFLTVALPAREELGERERRLLSELVASAAPALDAERLALELGEPSERDRIAGVLEARLIARLDEIAAELRGGADDARLAAAYAATAEMVDDTRRLAHALASDDGLDAGARDRADVQLAADVERPPAHRI
jgi:hypothetical protein